MTWRDEESSRLDSYRDGILAGIEFRRRELRYYRDEDRETCGKCGEQFWIVYPVRESRHDWIAWPNRVGGSTFQHPRHPKMCHACLSEFMRLEEEKTLVGRA